MEDSRTRAEIENIQIRRARLDEWDLLYGFLREVYGHAAHYKRHCRWRWQFLESPFHPNDEPDPSVWVAVRDGRIIGQIAVQDDRLWLEGKALTAGWIVDVVVHKDFRGLGLAHQIHKAVEAERGVLVTLTMAEATRKVAKRAGSIELPPVTYLALTGWITRDLVAQFLLTRGRGSGLRRVVARKIAASSIATTTIAVCLRLMSQIICSRLGDQGTNDIEILEVSKFPEDVSSLFYKLALPKMAIFDRSLEFLNWRFVEAPDLNYRRFLAWKSDRVVGYIVIRNPDPSELKVGVIADLLVDPEEPSAYKALVRRAIDELRNHCEAVELGTNSAELLKYLRSLGFLPFKKHRPTIVVQDPMLRSMIQKNSYEWHFSKADHDWDQVHPKPNQKCS